MQIFSRIYSCTYLTLTSLLLVSCSGGNAEKQVVGGFVKEPPTAATKFSFNTDPASVVKDFNTWWNYHYRNINLTEEFIGLDADSIEIKKERFLTELSTGKYVPIRLALTEGVTWYQLYPLKKTDLEISATIKDDAGHILVNYRMEGKQLPSFSFVDLRGIRYDPVNTRGKILVLKCWFIHCVACVQEFPELNKLVDEFKDRPDVLFISLAMDQKPALQKFLETREFKYATVADKKSFMKDNLQISQYPTHLIVDKDGKIRKVVNRCEEMVPALKRLVKQSG